MNHKIKNCIECQSDFFIDSATMLELCPECAYQLYSHKNCEHHFENGRCVMCFWNGNKSEFLKYKTSNK